MAVHAFARVAIAAWRSAQVELRGQYSNEQLKRFEEYQSLASLGRVAAVCVLTPLPTLLVIILLNMLRLEPVEKGAVGSTNVWLRQLLVMVAMSLCTLQQLRHHLPEFKINWFDCILITLISATTDVAFAIAMACVIGYPVPFTVIVGSIPWYLTFIVVFGISKYFIIRQTPGSFTKMWWYIVVSLCQLTMTLVYPVYGYIYKRLSPVQQTGFVVILPLIKLVTKNWIYRALPDSDDAKPEAIVFNVEVFHSLFVSLCMGNTTSGRTVALLMCVDVIESWIGFHDIALLLAGLRPVSQKLKLTPPGQNDRLSSITTVANEIDRSDLPIRVPIKILTACHCWRLRRSVFAFEFTYVNTSAKILRRVSNKHRVSPLTDLQAHTATKSNFKQEAVLRAERALPSIGFHGPRRNSEIMASVRAVLTPDECNELVRQTQKLLFIIEFIVLVEYTEVIMPTIYNILVLAFYHTPNREFYTFFEGICTHVALHVTFYNVQMYSALEFASLAILALVLWHKIGLSVVHQLAFVLEDRAVNIQSKLLL